MRELVVGTFLTQDGVMQAPGGPDEDRDSGFEHGGWGVPLFDETMGEVMTDPQDPIAAVLNERPKYVASRTLVTANWRNTAILKGDIAAEVRTLKQQEGGQIQVHGSCNLIQTLLQHDLIDQFRLWVHPILLGTGKRLFGGGTVPSGLKLTETVTSTTGVVLHVYQRTGKPAYGSFALEDADAPGFRTNEAWRTAS
ncbi:MAG: dihydrofolate reductase family protein [Thermoanaerobaculia bacterium]